MKIVDLHCDTIIKFRDGHLRGLQNSHIELSKLKKGETLAQCFAIFVPTNMPPERQALLGAPDEYFEWAYGAFCREMELCADEIGWAKSVADIRANEAKGLMSAILTVEDGVTLNGKIENVDKYYDLGVRMVALTWNFENSLGYPQSMDPEKHALPLKPFGIEAVGRMNELGIAVDVSHLSEGGFWSVYENTKKPFIASHSCARALCDVGRNLTDKQLRAVAEKGGVVGINYLSGFLHAPTGSPDDNVTTIEQIAWHLDHIRNVAGIDTLALGSDYDGMHSTLQWGDAGGQQLLVQGLEKTFTPAELEKICYKNALRALEDIIGK